MLLPFILLLAALPQRSFATSSESMSREGMAQMPLARETRTFTVTGLEKWDEVSGFGPAEPSIQAMTLMMVEGPVVPSASATPPARSPYTVQPLAPPRRGDAWFSFTLLDPASRKPVAGLHLSAVIQMNGMKMGTQEVPVEEPQPGLYRATAGFLMKGSWCVRILNAEGETGLCFEVSS